MAFPCRHDAYRHALRATLRWLYDAGLWMAPAFGVVPPEIFAPGTVQQRGDDGPLPAGATAPSGAARLPEAPVPLSAAEQRQWNALVKDLQMTRFRRRQTRRERSR